MKLNLFDIKNKVVLVSGNLNGPGAWVAEGLGMAGANIICFCHSTCAEMDQSINQFRKDGIRVVGFPLRPLTKDVLEKSIERGEAMMGPIDVVVFSLHDKLTTFNPIEDEDLPEFPEFPPIFRFVYDRVSRHMREREKGKIIVIEPIHTTDSPLMEGCCPEVSSPMEDNIETMAQELAPHNIQANLIRVSPLVHPHPHMIKKPHLPPNLEAMISQTPCGRPAHPEDMVGAVHFLASEASNFITGQTLSVDGGCTMLAKKKQVKEA